MMYVVKPVGPVQVSTVRLADMKIGDIGQIVDAGIYMGQYVICCYSDNVANKQLVSLTSPNSTWNGGSPPVRLLKPGEKVTLEVQAEEDE